MGEEEALKTRGVLSNTSDSVHDLVDQFLADSVVTTGVVVGGVFLAGDELLGMEQVSVLTVTDLINHIGLKIDVDGSGNVLSAASFREKSGEALIAGALVLLTSEVTIGLQLRVRMWRRGMWVLEIHTWIPCSKQ